MKRNVLTGILLTLFLASTLTITLHVQPVKAEPGTIYIRADGSVDPPTAPVSSVDNVTYTFADNIYDSIVVERDNIVIDGAGYTVQGAGSEVGINVTMRSNVTIKNIEIKTFFCGITLAYSSNNSFSGNNVTNNYYYGIGLIASSNNTISRNNIKANNGCGIELIASSNNSIFGNNITSNGYGIVLYRSSDNILRGNSMANNTYNFGVNAITFQNSVNYVDVSNTVDGKPIYYWINKRDMAVPLDAGYVALVNCTRITLQNLSLTNNIQGTLFALTTNSTITKNEITNNHDEGIYFYNSSKNTISGNNITNNFEGIRLRKSSNNTISGNNITNNNRGIMLEYGANHNNVLINNNIANNAIGIDLNYNSNLNSIVGNNITNNNYGVRLQQSSNNTFRRNNFINNKQQVLIVSVGYANFWDTGYPSGGNYWSDYAGVDLYRGPYQNETGSDGIGDTPYVIDENNRDNYPVMYPYALAHGPTAFFTYEPTTPFVNQTVTFNSSGSLPGWNGTHNLPIANYTWNFGDGTSTVNTTSPKVTHIYTAEGVYTVSLTVTCEDDPVLIAEGLTSDTALQTVNVAAYAKVYVVDQADWTRWNLTNVYSPGDSFTLDVIIENVTDLYGWDIGAVWDPNILTCTGFTEGTFLTSSGYPTLGIDGTIDNVAGKIDPMYGRALKGATKGQNGSSTDPGKGALASLGFILDPTLVYYDKTWINLTITLWDSRMKPITMTVNNAFWLYPPPPHGPIAHFTYSPNDAFINVNTTFDASASSPGWSGTVTIPIAEYAWDFGDGTQVTTTNPAVTHTYTAVGNYTVTLTVTDDKGNWNTITQTATVNLAEFSLVALYTLHLDLNYWSSEGAKLTAAFYTYEGVYQGNMTVWTGETPTWVELSTDIVHPQGKPIEIVKLVLTDDFGNVLHTVKSYAIRRSDLMGTLGELDHLWTVPGADRTAIMKEYVTIDGQWSYAPP